MEAALLAADALADANEWTRARRLIDYQDARKSMLPMPAFEYEAVP